MRIRKKKITVKGNQMKEKRGSPHDNGGHGVRGGDHNTRVEGSPGQTRGGPMSQ